MYKLKILGRLAFNNDSNCLYIDDYEINIGDTIYLKKKDRHGKSKWISHIVDFNLNSHEWFLGGKPMRPQLHLGRVVKIDIIL